MITSECPKCHIMRGDDGECPVCKCEACIEMRDTGKTKCLHHCGLAQSFAAEADTLATTAPIRVFPKAS